MVGDIIALAEFIEKWVGKKTEVKRNLIEDFVDPVFSLFEKIHDDYLTTFRTYQDKIKSSNPLNLSAIIQEIERDSLFSENLRHKLSASLSVKNDLLSEFVQEIDTYLKSPQIILYQTTQPWSNVRRNSLIQILGWVDRLTPELIISSGLLNDIQNVIQNKIVRLGQSSSDPKSQYLIYNLELTIRNPDFQSSEINISESELAEIKPKLLEIQKYLAVQCINLLIKETQENYNSVVDSYWRLKFGSIKG
jgi:hypothetical protein